MFNSSVINREVKLLAVQYSPETSMAEREIIIRAAAFGIEGPPRDKGLSLGRTSIEEWGEMCIRGGANSFTSFTPLSLGEESWCVQEFSWDHRLIKYPQYHQYGLGAWTAVILRRTIESSNDGDVVVV